MQFLSLQWLNETTLISASRDHHIALWSMINPKHRVSISNVPSLTNELIEENYTKKISRKPLLGYKTQWLSAVEVNLSEAQKMTKGHQNKIRAVRLSPQKDMMATLGGDGFCKLWDIKHFQPVSYLRL